MGSRLGWTILLLIGLIGLPVSAHYSPSDRSCKSDRKQGCREFCQADPSENLTLIPLSKLELDGVASVLCFHQEQGCAECQCSTSVSAPNMRIIFETWLAYVLLMYTAIRMEKFKDISSIKSHQVVNTFSFWMPVALDADACQLWSIPWDPGGCMFALHRFEKMVVISVAGLRISESAGSMGCGRLEFSAYCWQTPCRGGRNALFQITFLDQPKLDHEYYIAFLDQIPVNYNSYLDDDTNKIMEVHDGWDPDKLAPRYPVKTSAWGQAEFQGGRNVMDLDTIRSTTPSGKTRRCLRRFRWRPAHVSGPEGNKAMANRSYPRSTGDTQRVPAGLEEEMVK